MKNERYSKVAGAGGTIRSLTCKAELMLKKKQKNKKTKNSGMRHISWASAATGESCQKLKKRFSRVITFNLFCFFLLLFPGNTKLQLI